jgi:CIC family chloride channel protein
VTAGSGLIRSIRARLRTADYLRKWVVLGGVIGVISGLGAAAFFLALELATRFFLGVLAGFVPASPVGEGGDPFTEAVRPWAIPMVVGLGGLVSGIIVFRLAPEAEGHGTDAAISAFHHGARRIRSRIPLIKLVASAITIGSGGSAGREGPTAQIGAGFGSLLARVLDLDARDARIAVSCGLGAGIGAIFRAPLGGAVLAAEIPYREDVESEALVPAFVASIVSFAIFGALVGYTPIFGRVAGTGFTQPIQLVYYVIIGLVAGLVGRLYIGTFYRTTRWFDRWRLPREVRPAIAGFAVGCLGIIVPGALGTGYGWVQASLDRTSLLALPFAMVLVLPFAKIVATSLSIGSGGSGGIFARAW